VELDDPSEPGAPPVTEGQPRRERAIRRVRSKSRKRKFGERVVATLFLGYLLVGGLVMLSETINSSALYSTLSTRGVVVQATVVDFYDAGKGSIDCDLSYRYAGSVYHLKALDTQAELSDTQSSAPVLVDPKHPSNAALQAEVENHGRAGLGHWLPPIGFLLVFALAMGVLVSDAVRKRRARNHAERAGPATG
jgi:hypothetical protein